MIRRPYFTVPVILFLIAAPAAAEEAPRAAEVILARNLRSYGIRCPEPQDLAFQFLSGEVGDKTYRAASPEFPYLYFDLSESVKWDKEQGLYITVQYFDGRIGELRLQYDSSDPALEEGPPRAHKRHWQRVWLERKNRWENVTFHVEDPQFLGGQAGGCDFRLEGADIPIHRVYVTAAAPPGARVLRRPDRVLESRPRLTPKPPVSFVIDSPWAKWNGQRSTPLAHERAAGLYFGTGATALETYVAWADVCPKKAVYDWEALDQELEQIKKAGFRWAPFLILGPHYATPDWFTESRDSSHYVCLEHGEECPIQSLWNPRLRPYVEEFLWEFAAHYRETGMIDHILLGITGNWGENYLPVGGGFYEERDRFHCHKGLWVGDPDARRDFQRYLKGKYGTFEALAKAWGEVITEASGANVSDPFTAIQPGLIDSTPAGTQGIDLLEWAALSMNEYAAFWARTARECFPKERIFIAGGGIRPWLGSAGGSLAKSLQPYRVGLRYCGQDGILDPPSMFIGSSCRFYGLPFGFEPAIRPDHSGELGRMVGNIFLGSQHSYSKGWDYVTLAGEPEGMACLQVRKILPLRGEGTPQPNSLAMLLPTTAIYSDESVLDSLYQWAARLRDVSDFDLIDEDMIGDGALGSYGVILLVDRVILKERTFRKLDDWVREGGVLLGFHREAAGLFPAGDAPERQWFGEKGFDPLAWETELRRGSGGGPAPAGVLVDIGDSEDGLYFTGNWNLPESAHWEWGGIPNERHKRWTRGTAGFLVRLDESVDYRMQVTAYQPPFLESEEDGTILVGGETVGALIPGATRTMTFRVAGGLFADGPVEVRFVARAWRPSEALESSDSRVLGVAVEKVLFIADEAARGAEALLATPAKMGVRVDADLSIASTLSVRRHGQGWTLRGNLQFPPGETLGGQVLVEALTGRKKAFPWGNLFQTVDARFDDVLSARFQEKVLCFNNSNTNKTCFPVGPDQTKTVAIPAFGLALVELEN